MTKHIYYTHYGQARQIRDSILDAYPEVRIVEYLKGYAVQYRPSGAYYPEILDETTLDFKTLVWR